MTEQPTEESRRPEKGVPPGGRPDRAAQFAGPTDEEVEAWAERERRRRAAWVEGPSDEEKELWAERRRHRRAGYQRSGGPRGDFDDGPGFDPFVQRYYRDMQLAAEGMVNWMSNWPFRLFASLVRAGQDWEEASFRPRRRRRIAPFDDDF
jgi:hypothetical protein